MKSVDKNVNEICGEFVDRSNHGFKKYGVTTERTDLNFDQWLQHLKEELMDAVVYIHRVQQDRKNKEVLQKDLFDIEEDHEGC